VHLPVQLPVTFHIVFAVGGALAVVAAVPYALARVVDGFTRVVDSLGDLVCAVGRLRRAIRAELIAARHEGWGLRRARGAGNALTGVDPRRGLELPAEQETRRGAPRVGE
jgi:hypothetical protein